MQVKGHTGTVEFARTSVTITRTGFLARASVGKGGKRIPLGQITAVQFKPAGILVNGFIAFTVGGGNEQRSRFGRQTTDAAHDENGVIFWTRQQAAFEQLRDAIEAAMVTPAGAVQPDAVDQLRRLAELRDAGVVSSEEFNTAKARLLGGIS
ncbi:MAG: DUF4429 domain-containing protein [Pseudonocardiaceae bacterium]